MKIRMIVMVTAATGLIIISVSMFLWNAKLYALIYHIQQQNPSLPNSSMIHDTSKHQVLLTIFTTLKNVKDRVGIHTNTIRNWALFLPHIQPVLLTTYIDSLSKTARHSGWIVLTWSDGKEIGLPKLKSLYFTVMNHTNHSSIFYGFCNADILFDEGLLETLKVVAIELEHLTTPMLIGQRTNVKLSMLTNPDDFYQWFNITTAEGSLFRQDAEDYFFIGNAHDFIWDKLKDVAVGLPGYDNYLVVMAIRHNISVIDATNTIKAVHQTGKDGNYAGHHRKNVGYNYKVIGEFGYDAGVTSNAQYITIQNNQHRIQLQERKCHDHNEKTCK